MSFSNLYFSIRRTPGESNLEYHKIVRHLFRLRDKKYPKRPQTDAEVKALFKNKDIFEEFGLSLNEQHPLYVDSVVEKKYAFHVFASFANIELTEEWIPPHERKYLMDGTFKIVPRQFKKGQLLIISIEYQNDVSTYYVSQ